MASIIHFFHFERTFSPGRVKFAVVFLSLLAGLGSFDKVKCGRGDDSTNRATLPPIVAFVFIRAWRGFNEIGEVVSEGISVLVGFEVVFEPVWLFCTLFWYWCGLAVPVIREASQLIPGGIR